MKTQELEDRNKEIINPSNYHYYTESSVTVPKIIRVKIHLYKYMNIEKLVDLAEYSVACRFNSRYIYFYYSHKLAEILEIEYSSLVNILNRAEKSRYARKLYQMKKLNKKNWDEYMLSIRMKRLI